MVAIAVKRHVRNAFLVLAALLAFSANLADLRRPASAKLIIGGIANGFSSCCALVAAGNDGLTTLDLFTLGATQENADVIARLTLI